MKSIKILFVLLFWMYEGYGQTPARYLILFKDKANSSYQISKPQEFLSQRAIARREKQKISITSSDFPVNPAYVTGIKQTGAVVLYTTKWFNGAVVDATPSQLNTIKSLPFFKGVERDIALLNPAGSARVAIHNGKFAGVEEGVDQGRMKAQLAMLGVPLMHDKGIHGEGILIAVMDAGFSRADQLTYLKPLFDEKRIIDTYDFVARNTNVYDDHFHGLNVLSTIAAYQPGVMVGAAYAANFLLYRTENELSETPYEEVTWLLAAERADSLGVDVINTSLGYNTFDDPADDYTYGDMDGKTATISRAARWATRKGIVVVNAAGNSGNLPWKYITAPADVDSVLTVGSVDLNGIRWGTSSIGPASNQVMKPDVAAVGHGAIIGNDVGTGGVSSGTGTSFASPQIAGLSALIWQKYPQLSAQDVLNVLRKAGSQASKPDNFLGFGIPSVTIAEEIIKKEYTVVGNEPKLSPAIKIFPNPVRQELKVAALSGETGAKATFVLYSMAGVRLWSEERYSDRENAILVRHLSPGLYLLAVHAPTGVRTVKFIKE